MGRPESSRKRGARQFFFVNNRYMRHAYFHKAIQEAFASLIPADEQVPYFIYFDVEPNEIDVNIHPTKTEIKFENEQAIWQILMAAVREALGRFNAIPTIEFDTEGRPDIPVFTPTRTGKEQPPHIPTDPSYNPFHTATSHGPKSSAKGWDTLYPPLSPQPSEQPEGTLGPSPTLDPSSRALIPASELFLIDLNQQPLIAGLTRDLSQQPLIDLSTEHFQFKGQYIMTAAHSGLMLIDQHRAHIRVLHDRYLTRLSQSTIPSQQLLFPEQIQLSAADASVLERIAPDLRRLGFAFAPASDDTWDITGMPSGLEGVMPGQVLNDLIASGAANTDVAAEQLLSRLALVVARAAAIPTGQVLSAIEMQDLIDQLFATSNPNLTPDGKPIIVIISQDTIDKQFK